MTQQIHEVSRNFDFFQRHLAALLTDHVGDFALLRSCAFEGFFASPGLAYAEGNARFPDGRFSIQEVIEEPIDLGFFSHVPD